MVNGKPLNICHRTSRTTQIRHKDDLLKQQHAVLTVKAVRYFGSGVSSAGWPIRDYINTLTENTESLAQPAQSLC